MTSVINPGRPGVDRPYHDVRGSGADLVVTPGAPIGLDRAGAGNRLHLVGVSIGSGFHPVQRRRPTRLRAAG
jgi:hypothetical protein